MKFNSLKEYFYRLNNAGYQAMMVPLILFIFFYAQSFFYQSVPVLQSSEQQNYFLFGIMAISISILTLVQRATVKKANRIASQVGLGLKLEQLSSVLLVRMVWQAIITALMPIGLVFTGQTVFAIAFGVALAGYFLFWPTPGRVARLLKLKGDERELVMSRGEAF